jgi:hypothetical protein
MQNGVSHWTLSFENLELPKEYETHFWPCIGWLEAEGLISVGSHARTLGGIANGYAMNVSLTSKGMALLGQKIEVRGQNTTIAEQVEARAKGEISVSGIGDFFGGLLGGFTKSMSS